MGRTSRRYDYGNGGSIDVDWGDAALAAQIDQSYSAPAMPSRSRIAQTPSSNRRYSQGPSNEFSYDRLLQQTEPLLERYTQLNLGENQAQRTLSRDLADRELRGRRETTQAEVGQRRYESALDYAIKDRTLGQQREQDLADRSERRSQFNDSLNLRRQEMGQNREISLAGLKGRLQEIELSGDVEKDVARENRNAQLAATNVRANADIQLGHLQAASQNYQNFGNFLNAFLSSTRV